MSSSGIIISYEAAERDVRNLEQAKATLNDALAALNNLVVTSGTMEGLTGNAINQKAQILVSRLNALNANLENAQRAINAAVEEKRDADERAAQMINKNGVI